MHARQLSFGLIGGLLFFAHAMINNSHAWPLIWPALAGGLIVWTNRAGDQRTYGSDVWNAAVVGIVAGAVFLVATSLALSQLGLSDRVGLAGLAFAGAIGVVGALLGGALMHPLARRT